MFENYTTARHVEFRSRCAEMILETNDNQERGDALLLLKHIDEELAMREFKQSA
jgi:hypothetical protein